LRVFVRFLPFFSCPKPTDKDFNPPLNHL
jgi:hypothetical protein